MGYHIKVEELLNAQNSILAQIATWQGQLEGVIKALSQVAETQAVEGKMGESIRSYMKEVHLPLAASLSQMLVEFQLRFSIYVDGYYNIDSSYDAEILQDSLENQHLKLISEDGSFQAIHDTIREALASVGDIVSLTPPRASGVVNHFQSLQEQTANLNETVGTYEYNHERDSQSIQDMMQSIQAILDHRSGSAAAAPMFYQGGSILSLPDYKNLGESITASATYISANIKQYEQAIERFQVRLDDKMADERVEEGIWTVIGGIASIVAGAALIIATAGMATPLVVGAFAVGSTSMLYGISNSQEGVNSIALGFQGDGTTKANNPIRDLFFAGNPDLYYTIGNASTMISAFAIPMGGAASKALQLGSSPMRAMVVEGGKLLISGMAADASSKQVYEWTGNKSLSNVSGILVGFGAYGGLSKVSQVTNLGGLNGRVKGTGGTKSIDPNKIRYSQSSVNGSEEIANSMKKSGWKGDPIDIVEMPDGSYTTIDNTRGSG